MSREEIIDNYLNFYNTVIHYLKKQPSYSDWREILKYQDFVENLDNDKIRLNEVENVQKEIDAFVKKYSTATIEGIMLILSLTKNNHNLKLDFTKEREYSAAKGDSFSDFLFLNPPIQLRNAKKHLKNGYKVVEFVKRCLDNCGLLIEEIKKREGFKFYNFVIFEPNGKRKRTIGHYYISKEEMEQYVSLFNYRKDILVNGQFVGANRENSVLVSATKLKNEQEIELYKKRYRIYSDLPFAKSSICENITSLVITPIVPTLTTKQHKTLKNLLEDSNLKEALKVALTKNTFDEDDKQLFRVLQSRLNKLEKEKHSGGLSDERYLIEYNKINTACIAVIGNLED